MELEQRTLVTLVLQVSQTLSAQFSSALRSKGLVVEAP